MKTAFLRLLGVLLLALCLPAIAADYTVAPDGTLLAQVPPKMMPGGGAMKPPPPSGPQTDPGSAVKERHPGDYCCVHCRAKEKPCGAGCIGEKEMCMYKQTCACSGKP